MYALDDLAHHEGRDLRLQRLRRRAEVADPDDADGPSLCPCPAHAPARAHACAHVQDEVVDLRDEVAGALGTSPQPQGLDTILGEELEELKVECALEGTQP